MLEDAGNGISTRREGERKGWKDCPLSISSSGLRGTLIDELQVEEPGKSYRRKRLVPRFLDAGYHVNRASKDIVRPFIALLTFSSIPPFSPEIYCIYIHTCNRYTERPCNKKVRTFNLNHSN